MDTIDSLGKFVQKDAIHRADCYQPQSQVSAAAAAGRSADGG